MSDTVKVGCRLRDFVSEWLNITSDPFIFEILSGYKIPFHSVPSQRTEPPVRKFSAKETIVMNDLVSEYVRLGAISLSPEETDQFVSSVFPIPKSDGKHRLIFNLAPLNEFIDSPHFKLEDYRSVRALLTKHGFMGKVDIRHAYLHVPIAPIHRKYLKFRWDGQLYQFECLPFGLSLAPWVFTKLLRPVMGFLREKGYVNNIFLDDIWLHGDSQAECLDNIKITVSTLTNLGFFLNFEKSVTIPTQEIEYLGFIFNSSDFTMKLPDKKKMKVKDLCSEALTWSVVKIRDVSKLLGTLVASAPAVPYGMLYTRALAVEENRALTLSGRDYDGSMTISNDVKEDIYWWIQTIKGSSQRVRHDSYDCTIFTDSSISGWGAEMDDNRIHGFWSVEERPWHINIKELQAIFIALQCFLDSQKDLNVLLRVDNQVAIAYLNKLGGCHCPKLLEISRNIWKWAENRRIWLFASYIESAKNFIADAESRREVESNDWRLGDCYFSSICTKFYFPDIDLFATAVTRRCNLFCAWKPSPGAHAIDAFTISWKNLKFYAFPPFNLIPRVLRKIKNENASGILVVPYWPSQNWFPRFLKLSHSQLLFMGPNYNLLTCPYTNRAHPLWEKLQLVAAIV